MSRFPLPTPLCARCSMKLIYFSDQNIYIFSKFIKNKSIIFQKKKIIGFIMWFLRSHSESYQAAAFLLLTFDRIWIYYTSVYHYWYGVWLIFLIIGLFLNQVHRAVRPKKVKEEKKQELK